MKPVFFGTTTHAGFFDMAQAELDKMVEYIQSIGPDERVRITIDKAKENRKVSNPQFRYYYGVICKLLGEHTGHTKDEIDSALKWMFLKQIDDLGVPFVPSKTQLTTVQIEQFHQRCRDWALVALDVYIPRPHEVKLDDIEF